MPTLHPRLSEKIERVRRRALHLLARRPRGWRRRYSACVREEARWCRGRDRRGWRQSPLPIPPRRCRGGFLRFHGEADPHERAAINAARNCRIDLPDLAADGLPRDDSWD